MTDDREPVDGSLRGLRVVNSLEGQSSAGQEGDLTWNMTWEFTGTNYAQKRLMITLDCTHLSLGIFNASG